MIIAHQVSIKSDSKVLVKAVIITKINKRKLPCKLGISSDINKAYNAISKLLVIISGRKSETTAPKNVPKFHDK